MSKRDVVTGPANGKLTTIISRLAAGDKVVVDGVDRLRDGAKVKVAEAAAGTGAPETNEGGGGAGEGGAGGHRHRHAQGDQAGGGNSPGAAACAAALPTEAKTIYAAAAPEFASSADPRALVKAKVVVLVKAGAVQKESARSTAMAASDCLQQLSSARGAAAQPATGGPPSRSAGQ